MGQQQSQEDPNGIQGDTLLHPVLPACPDDGPGAVFSDSSCDGAVTVAGEYCDTGSPGLGADILDFVAVLSGPHSGDHDNDFSASFGPWSPNPISGSPKLIESAEDGNSEMAFRALSACSPGMSPSLSWDATTVLHSPTDAVAHPGSGGSLGPEFIDPLVWQLLNNHPEQILAFEGHMTACQPDKTSCGDNINIATDIAAGGAISTSASRSWCTCAAPYQSEPVLCTFSRDHPLFMATIEDMERPTPHIPTLDQYLPCTPGSSEMPNREASISHPHPETQGRSHMPQRWGGIHSIHPVHPAHPVHPSPSPSTEEACATFRPLLEASSCTASAYGTSVAQPAGERPQGKQCPELESQGYQAEHSRIPHLASASPLRSSLRPIRRKDQDHVRKVARPDTHETGVSKRYARLSCRIDSLYRTHGGSDGNLGAIVQRSRHLAALARDKLRQRYHAATH
ncbi:uncharacterized protein BJ171DRAFT_58312 [Polychytrium aggregatum]|uniref:uncharacterized protein n=1 Tax=Polychytrium aggregatum TaxID=110093 RepID=UPI0022FF3CE0|nr:uncharacterized protein BJ171DRAFT_58312 [Polychytrium aggregatum]KAI9190737.1 hypothetical protein BJ171DRAFT_58312 [Polychytrium aggregatum]